MLGILYYITHMYTLHAVIYYIDYIYSIAYMFHNFLYRVYIGVLYMYTYAYIHLPTNTPEHSNAYTNVHTHMYRNIYIISSTMICFGPTLKVPDFEFER